MKKCNSCGIEVSEKYVDFMCPNCGKSTVIRCPSCRVLGAKYTCEDCGFTGP